MLKKEIDDNSSVGIKWLGMKLEKLFQNPIAHGVYFRLEELLKSYKVSHLIDVKISDRLLWSERKLQ